MSSNEIIEIYYKDKELNEIFKRVTTNNLAEDLKQDVFEILLNKKKKLIIELHNKKELKLYIYRIVWNLISQPNNSFFKNYKTFFLPLFEVINIKYNDSVGNVIEYIEDNKLIPKKNRSSYLYVDEQTPIDYLIEKEDFLENKKLLKKIDYAIEKLPTYYYILFKAYIQFGKYSILSRETGIPDSTIQDAIKKAKALIKQNL